MTRRGFPHSDIPGSKLICSSPRLFAAYRVLHRLLAPRHSPYALSSLIIGIQELTIDALRLRKTRSRQSLFPPSLETLRVFCDTEKLPFAGYSIVKDQLGSSPNFCDDSSPQTSSGTRASSGCVRCPGRGGEYRDRTGDLLVANQALSQLS